MKDTLLIFLFFSLFSDLTFGQNNNYKLLNDTEQELINDLSSTFKDTSISFLFSPFINLPVDTSSLDIKELTKKYGFNKELFSNFTKDTLILERNDYFKIINPDSLSKYMKIQNFTLLDVSNDSLLLLNDPVLYYINKYYGKLGICNFHKVVYSKNRNYALVEYWMHCGFLCGYGEIIVMKKVKNKWIKLETIVISES